MSKRKASRQDVQVIGAESVRASVHVGGGAGQAAPVPFPVDMDRMLGSLNSTFNPLHPGCQLDFYVSGAKDGYVCVSVALPEGMTRAFVTLLESMHGFFRCVDIKARSAVAQVKAEDPSFKAEVEKLQSDYREKCCEIFDGFRKQGHDKLEALKLTNRALKEKGHPWATYEIVMTALRSAGRLRK